MYPRSRICKDVPIWHLLTPWQSDSVETQLDYCLNSILLRFHSPFSLQLLQGLRLSRRPRKWHTIMFRIILALHIDPTLASMALCCCCCWHLLIYPIAFRIQQTRRCRKNVILVNDSQCNEQPELQRRQGSVQDPRQILDLSCREINQRRASPINYF